MKKKLLVLSASAVLASHFLVGGEASAIVTGEENPYKSKALSIMEENNTPSITTKQYKDNLEDLIYYLTIGGYEKYDEPEYAKTVKKYKQRFMAEMDAMNQFLQEEKTKEQKKQPISNKALGLTYQRYIAVYNELVKNKEDFEKEIAELNKKHPDLKTFNHRDQDRAEQQLNDLENQILMLGQTFTDNVDARNNLYNKLDMSIGYTKKERKEKQAVNQRMLDRKVEDLETIIDEFFEEIDLARPIEIPVLSAENEKDDSVKNQLRDDAKKAKENENLRHPRAQKQKATEAQSQSSHQEVAQPSVNSLEIEEPQTVKPQQPVYTETTVHTPMTTAPQMTEETTFEVPQGRNAQPSATVNSEQAPETVTAPAENTSKTSEQVATPALQQDQPSEAPQQASVETETITESHVIDIDESTTFEKSGYLYGFSQSDTSGYTEREKRAIRRNHVREAESLVNQYVDTHRYQDRIAAQQKVNTLSDAHQKRFNKMINKAYNGQ
ncbi:coagulase domain-containing protein [Staphylococcus cornubiensis]|uniref:coagulase domain-containing protein n=1 Tax=Staphylococcus cornubiensis TaxID=1986155 RepID=UPI000A379EFA|nr:coagulase domain-containing protein [Staphylococcus cornubiensis]